MKNFQFYTVLTLLLFSVTVFSQKNKEIPVTIVNANSRAFMLLDDFFTAAISEKILTQIDAATFLNVKQFSAEGNYPLCIQELLEYNVNDPDNETADITIKSLKAYRIAVFDNERNGENFGEESILWIPASENKNVGGNCNFEDDFYIFIPSKDIKL